MSEVKSTQTRNPKVSSLAHRLLDHKNYDYFPVQKDTKDYKSPLSDYLFKESINHPGQPMYEIVADGEKDFQQRALAGASDNVLLRIRKEDKKALLKQVHDDAMRRMERKKKTTVKTTAGEIFESEETTTGGVLTG